MRRCPYNRFHIKNECHCVPGNSFVFNDGRWRTVLENHEFTQHHMLSFSGQLTNSDFLITILKTGLISIILVSIIAGTISFYVGKAGKDLKQMEQTKIERAVK
jgi:hypothetical protein